MGQKSIKIGMIFTFQMNPVASNIKLVNKYHNNLAFEDKALHHENMPM